MTFAQVYNGIQKWR